MYMLTSDLTCFRRGDELKQEAQKYITVKHRNVVSLLAVVYEPENHGLVFDDAEHGCMQNFIQDHHVNLHTILFLGICQGVTVGV